MATATKSSSSSKRASTASTSKTSSKATESIFLITHSEGWAIRIGDRTRAYRVFKTKNEAEQFGRDMAKRWKTEFVIQKADGKISQKDSEGHDPRSIKG